ncbi:hypothetical protein BKA62DRAFT_696849 [Auriculariales sp. MPI-PUGE-AT-0066]|nr:hypothetical protein BKA62DRAFT_696849 [Auriculariales sp. MPI-PUGE-AT-0066]
MSSSSTPNNDSGLLAVGEQCSFSTCNLIDFLPFTCQHCRVKFCLDHFQPVAHACPKYDASQDDRVAPDCPLCHTPVAFARGTDPNARMERHFAEDCAGMGHTKKSAANVCARKQCSKKLITPITCETCRQRFCPEHRFSNAHDCQPPAAKTTLRTNIFTSTNTSTSTSGTSFSAARPGPQAAAALAAMKRQLAAAKTAIKQRPTQTSATASSSARQADPPAPQPAPKVAAGTSQEKEKKKKVPNPFSKTDRRARSEAESKRKALRDRERKGLLSEADKRRLAEMDQQAAEADKEQCVIQ